MRAQGYGVPGLTKRQHVMLDVICAHIEEQGYSPTHRELMDLMDIKSTNGVADHLKALERKGYIERAEHCKVRTLKVLRDTAGRPYLTKGEQIARLQARVAELEQQLDDIASGRLVIGRA